MVIFFVFELPVLPTSGIFGGLGGCVQCRKQILEGSLQCRRQMLEGCFHCRIKLLERCLQCRKQMLEGCLGNGISETVLKSWSRLPEMMISLFLNSPFYPHRGFLVCQGAFKILGHGFSDFPGEAELRIAKISIFWSPKCHFFMLFFDHFWVIFWSLKTALSSILGP